jgi:hypothetical protein
MQIFLNANSYIVEEPPLSLNRAKCKIVYDCVMFYPRLQEVWRREQPLLSPSPSAAVAAAVAALVAAAAALACFDGLVPLVLPFLVELLLLFQSF